MPAMPADPNYSAEVERRFRDLPAAGELPPGEGLVSSASAGSRERGAEVELRARLGADGRVQLVRFRAYGCPHLIAAASWAAEQLTGASTAELSAWDWQAVATALDVPAAKYGRMLLLQDAVRRLGTASARPPGSAL